MKSETIPGSTDATGLFTAKSPYQALDYEKGGTYEAKIKAFEILYPPLFCYNENNELVKGIEGLEVCEWYRYYSPDTEWTQCNKTTAIFKSNCGYNIERIYKQENIAVQPTEKAEIYNNNKI